jgi:hypothetical protein
MSQADHVGVVAWIRPLEQEVAFSAANQWARCLKDYCILETIIIIYSTDLLLLEAESEEV